MQRIDRDDVDDWAEGAAHRWTGMLPVVEAVVTRIFRIGRHIDRTLAESSRHFGLNSSEYYVLAFLSESAPRSPGELGDRLLVSSGVMTNRLDRLESLGLIARRPNPNDRRGVWVELTDEGADTLGRLIELQMSKESALVGQLNEDELTRLNDLLRKMMRPLSRRTGDNVPGNL